MPRKHKIEVSAVNIRIPDEAKRNYSGLISALWKEKKGIRVYGDSYVAISYYDEKRQMGIISKYAEIDIDGDWFDLEDFDAAPPEKLEEISIPKTLRPNLSQFYFRLEEDLHVLVFSSYSDSKSLSARSMERYFGAALRWKKIVRRFGVVEADIVKSYGLVEDMLQRSRIRELRFIINRPNNDDMGKDLASVIEARLKDQNADRYEESVSAKGGEGLKPNDRTKKLAFVAAENGQMEVKSLVKGVVVKETTESSPLVEMDTYEADESEQVKFNALSKQITEKIRKHRKQVRERK